METSQALPLHAVLEDDLVEVVRGTPPFVSVFVVTESNVENAAQRAETRWRNLRGELENHDVDGELLDTIEAIVTEAHRSGDGVAVIADAQGIRLVDHGPLADADERAVVGDVPQLSPIVRWRQEEPTTLVVLTDRRGADVFALRRSDPDVERTVKGDDFPLRKVSPGGWSQRRIQERAENTWEANARSVAEVVERIADKVDPRVIAVAGDVRAVGLLQDSLRDEVRNRVEVVAGERPWDEATDVVPDEVRDLVRAAVRRDGDEMLQALQQELGQQDMAVEGLEATAAALAEARAAVLLVADVGEATLWIGEDPVQIATSAEALRAIGVDEPREVPAADAAVRAALATGAGVRVYDPRDPDGASSLDADAAPHDGIAAIVRWTHGEGGS